MKYLLLFLISCSSFAAIPDRISVGEIKAGVITMPNASPSTVPIFDGNKKIISSAITPIQLGGLNFPNVGGATHIANLYDFYNHIWSATSVSGLDLADNGNGTINVASGEALLRSAATEDSPISLYEVSATSNLALTDNSTNYIYVDYNSGTPIVQASILPTAYNCLDKCLIYKIVRVGTSLMWVDARNMGVDAEKKHRAKLFATDEFAHATGAVISDAGTQHVRVTAGEFLYALNPITTQVFDTTGTDTFTSVYRASPSGFTRTAGQSQIDVSNYDDGTGTLHAISNNKFANRWVYLVLDNPTKLYVVFGTEQYNSIADAKAGTIPTSLPPEIIGVGQLIGRIIVQSGVATFADVQTAYGKQFTSAVATSHNSLAGIQDAPNPVVNEHYHLSSQQATEAVTKTYGELYDDESTLVTAASVSVTNGTITSGTVSDTYTVNQVYLDVQETGQFEIVYTFNELTHDPARLKFIGRYQGLTAHNVKLQFWNYNSSAWDNATTATTDFPNSTTDYGLYFNYPTSSSNYISGGSAQVKIIHTSTSNSAHHFYTDYISLAQKNIVVAAPGTFYTVSPLLVGISNDVTINATNGTIQTTRAGTYRSCAVTSFSGTSLTTFHSHVFQNSSEIGKCGFKRTINGNGDMAEASMCCLISASVNDIFSVRMTADTTNSSANIEYFNFNMTRL